MPYSRPQKKGGYLRRPKTPPLDPQLTNLTQPTIDLQQPVRERVGKQIKPAF